MHRLIIFSAITFFCFILWIIYMANTGQSSIFFDFVKILPYGDKIGHLFLFGILTLGMNVSLKFLQFRVGGIRVYWGTFLVMCFALIEELSQYFMPTRTFDLLDLIADVVGITVFTIISYFLGKKQIMNSSS